MSGHDPTANMEAAITSVSAGDSHLTVLERLGAPLYLVKLDSACVLWINASTGRELGYQSHEALISRELLTGNLETINTRLQCRPMSSAVQTETCTFRDTDTQTSVEFLVSAMKLNGQKDALLFELHQNSGGTGKNTGGTGSQPVYSDTALGHTSFMICVFDAHYRLVYANPAARESLPAHCTSMEEMLVNTDDTELIRSHLSETGRCDIELEVNTCGGLQWHYLNIMLNTDIIASQTLCIVSAINITEQRLAQQAAYKLAYNDSLTGLPNRAALYKLLQKLMQEDVTGDTTRFALFFLDLDRFKIINDSLGHSAGDQLLIHMAQILRQSLGTKGSVYRLGGDEFVMVITRGTRFEDLESVAESVRFASAAPIVIADQKLRVLASIGICRYPKDGSSVDELLDNADSAMYQAKSDQSGYCFFNRQQFASLNAKIKDRMCLENDLAEAVHEKEFELHFQPKLACDTLSVSGVEALLRWHHPQRGEIAPETFIKIAEDTGQIVDLGNWVLLAAMKQQKAWQDMGLQVPVSLNISARQFSANDLLADVSHALSVTGCNPRMIELEITESLLIGEPDAVFSTLQQLSAIGIRLALDDFGTGYSNLAYLQQYPLDCLKIDKIFLTDRKRSMLMATILDMGKVLGLELVAEGVETLTQAKWLAESPCDHMQGFYFSEPLSVKDVTDYILLHNPPDERRALRGTKTPYKAA